jgi:glycosyltransferase involved in cell wall biosynthesis
MLPKLPAYTGPARWALRKLTDRTYRGPFSSAAAISAVSQTYLDWGLRHAGRPEGGQDHVFPIGYQPPDPPKAVQEHSLAKWRKVIPPGRFVVLFTGIINSQVDIETVISACRRLTDNGDKSYHFVVCGDGPSLGVLRERSIGMSNLTFTGWLEGADLQAVLMMSSVGLVSAPEGCQISIGNKPYEYMAYRLPIVNSLRGELWDFIAANQCGLNYAPGDVAAMLAVLALYRGSTGLYEDHRAAGFTLWEKEFSEEAIYTQMTSWLEALQHG